MRLATTDEYWSIWVAARPDNTDETVLSIGLILDQREMTLSLDAAEHALSEPQAFSSILHKPEGAANPTLVRIDEGTIDVLAPVDLEFEFVEAEFDDPPFEITRASPLSLDVAISSGDMSISQSLRLTHSSEADTLDASIQ